MFRHQISFFTSAVCIPRKKILLPIEPLRFKNSVAKAIKFIPQIEPSLYFRPFIENFERTAFAPYFWFILDFSRWTNCDAGGDLENLTPFTWSEFVGQDHTKLHTATYPEDISKVLAFSKVWIDICETQSPEVFQHLKMSMYFRMANRHGKYYWIMVQYPEAILDESGRIMFGLVLVTDISHLKHDGIPMMNVFDQSTQKCQQFFCSDQQVVNYQQLSSPPFTNREREILRLLARGMNSKEIAAMLHLSIKTVDNHRQNMLRHSNSRNSSEMVSLGIKCGII